MKLKTNNIRDENKPIDLLPDSFESEEAAGEFWDSHSTMDYQEYLERVEDKSSVNPPAAVP